MLSHCFSQVTLVFEPGSLWKDVNSCMGERAVDLFDILFIYLFITFIFDVVSIGVM